MAISYTPLRATLNDQDPDTPVDAAWGQDVQDAVLSIYQLPNAAGDLVYATAADTLERLAIGASQGLLMSSGSAPSWLALGSNDEVLSVNTGALDYRKVVNAMVDSSAAIAYSKLALTSSLVNGDCAFTYSSYVPAWTSTGTAPALVSGTAVGSYLQLGDLVSGYFIITLAADSTVGTGTYRFSLPVAAAQTGLRFPIGFGTVNDTGMAKWVCEANSVTSTTVALFVVNSTTNHPAVSATVPMTPANGDSFECAFMYEAA